MTTTDTPYGLTIGINPGRGVAGAPYAYWTQLFADMKKAKLTWLRFQISWRNIELTQGTYTWTVLDDAVSHCNAAGINIMYTIRDAPDWALLNPAMKVSTEPFYLPDPDMMAAFATVVAQRYNGGAHGTINAYGFNEDFNIHKTSISDTFFLAQQLTSGVAVNTFTILNVIQTSTTPVIFSAVASQFTPEATTKLYFNGYNSADVATIKTNVALNNTSVAVNAFTPAKTYNNHTFVLSGTLSSGTQYTSFNCAASGAQIAAGTPVYLGAFGASDIAVISQQVNIGDTSVTIYPFTPGTTHNNASTFHVADTVLNIAYMAYHNSQYTLYNPGPGGCTTTLKSNPARDFWYAAKVVQKMYPAIKSVNPAVKIGSPVIWWTQGLNTGQFPGSPSNHTACVSDLFANGCAGLFDWVDVHYYSNGNDALTGSPQCNPIGPVTQTNTVLNDIQTVLNANGYGSTPVYVTEFGYQVPTDATTAQQATRYGEILSAVIGPSCNNKVFFYTLDYSTKPTQSSLVQYQATGGSTQITQPYGVTIGNPSATGTLNQQAITDMNAKGVTWLRYQVPWSAVDNSGTTNQVAANYHWGSWDDAVGKCNAGGINIILTIFKAPTQFQQAGNPDAPTFAATFAKQIAQRYNGGANGSIAGIELGNEDYDNSSNTSATPLVATMKAVYPAVKAVNANLTVGCAALLQRNSAHYTSFMETLLNPLTGAYAGTTFQADYLNFHFYTGIPQQSTGGPPVNLDPTVDVPSWNGGQGIPSITTAWQLIAAKKTQYNVTVPIWCTETGWTINTNPGRLASFVVSQALQWQYLQAVLDSCRTSGGQVQKVFIFTLGYFDGYGTGTSARDGMSLVQGSLASPIATTAFTSLGTYTSANSTWTGSGTSGSTYVYQPAWTTLINFIVSNPCAIGGPQSLTVYLTAEPSSTLSSANTLYTQGGGVNNINTATALDDASGWGEICAQGATTPWAGLGFAPAPSGNGFFLDLPLLENNTLLPGTYTAALRLNMIGTGAVNITADVHCRLWRYSLGSQAYVPIADCILANQTIKTTKVVFNPVFTTTAGTSFAVGDRLYVDLPANVLSNTGPVGTSIQLNDLSTETGTLTGLSTVSVILPGYQPSGGGGGGGSGGGGGGTIVIALGLFKDQQVQVFSPSGQFLGLWSDAPLLAGVKETLNSGTTQLQVELPRPFDSFDLLGSLGSNGTIGQGNIVKYYLFGPGLPATGLLRFQGKIDGYAPQIKENGQETVTVTISPFTSALGDGALANAQAFGTPFASSTYVDPVTMFKWFFQNNDPITGGIYPYTQSLTLDPTNPTSSGRATQYTFQNQTLLSIFQTILLMLPPNWFFRCNPDNSVTLNVAPTLAQHYLDLAQHVVNPQYNQDWSPLRNVIYFTGQSQASSANPNVQVPVVSATAAGADIATFGARYQFANDSRVTDQFTATILAQGLLNALDRYTLRTKIRVPDYRGDAFPTIGYDIESLRVGDTVQLVNTYGGPSSSVAQALWDTAFWDKQKWDAAYQSTIYPVTQIISIDYQFHYVDLELGSLQPSQDYALFSIQQKFLDYTMI